MDYLPPVVEDIVPDMEVASEPTGWRTRIGQAAGRLMLAGAMALGISAGAEAIDAEPAEAAAVSCYGDYCSGQYPTETGCDRDARTISKAVIKKAGVSLSVTVAKSPSASVSINPGESAVGILELRHSEKCGTSWARLNTKSGNRASMTGINFVGVQQDNGYTQKRDIGGRANGSPAAISFTPMIYGRGRAHRAFVESKNFAIASQDGTYWVNT